MSPLQGIVLVAAALAASTVAAVAGTGGGLLLLPTMTAIFGVRNAVPMYAVAQLIGNLSRVYVNRREIDARVVRWFVLGAIPAAMLGSWLFTIADDALLIRLLGAFLLIIVMARRFRIGIRDDFSHRWFAPIGAVFGCVSAAVGSAGPFLAPFYLSYGLVRGAFIGTEALGTAVMHVTKLATYQATGVLTPLAIATGLGLGPVMLVGTYLGKRIVDRVPPKAFALLIDGIVVGFGLWFLLKP